MNNNSERLLTNIQKRATAINEIHKHSDFLHKSIESLVLAHGQPFTKQIKSPFKGQPKSCFENCVKGIIRFPHLSYCEGFAIDDDLDFGISHAWLVNDNLEVIDPTWIGDRFQNSAYFGVIFNIDFVREVSFKTRSYGVLDSDYMMDYQLQRQGFPPHALKTFKG
ncbi:hypothetical protein [Trichormus variabilis]|uniref:Uncharacterized protein n=1 Tax=Trichormus variabilis SAG 1403-4b TaxID=447716 RepID=A0A3S1C027_ANAVA|nr:hypothetical protein [Trichormus variabilis]MBD2629654.1 hypothetical protein [Trichormus variabilis FACHB-164]RUS92929.1 hypothetical protein DSM107003_46760 [Trichormus variabilis SAG 1403-4b]